MVRALLATMLAALLFHVALEYLDKKATQAICVEHDSGTSCKHHDGALRQHAVAIKRRAGPQEDRKLVQLPRLVPGRPLRQSSIFIDISTASTTSTHGATGEPNAWDARPLYGTDCVAQRGPPRIHGRRAAHPVAATSSRDRGKQEDMHGHADERSECRRAWYQLPERHEVAARTG